MNDPRSSQRTATDAEVVEWLHGCLAEHAPVTGHWRPTVNTEPIGVMELNAGLPPTREGARHRLVTIAAAAVMVLGVGALAFAAQRDTRPSTATSPATAVTTDTPATPVDRPADAPELRPPGIGQFDSGTSTPAAASFATSLGDALAAAEWNLELRESATRRSIAGDDIQWAYFLDGDRRLFVAVGPADLLDTELVERLTPTSSGYDWPDQAGATTVALLTDAATIIVRSESVATAGPTRSRGELWTVAPIIASIAP